MAMRSTRIVHLPKAMFTFQDWLVGLPTEFWFAAAVCQLRKVVGWKWHGREAAAGAVS